MQGSVSALIVGKPDCIHSLRVESLYPPALLSALADVPEGKGGLVSSVQDFRTGMPRLWPKLLTPQGKGPPGRSLSYSFLPET